jgi:hypothetical protein
MHWQCKIVLHDYPIKTINLTCHIKNAMSQYDMAENIVVIDWQCKITLSVDMPFSLKLLTTQILKQFYYI